jgi:prepilin-type N-terminal cleavage/methylation domain-containing protein
MITSARARHAFTLIELLIVIGIIVLIASLGFLLIPNLDRNKGVPNATTQLQGWINLSKQQALRDKSPRGIRLINDGNGRCTSLQYIEQPEPVAPRGPGIYLELTTPTAGLTMAALKNGSTNPATPMTWEGVQPGDYLELTCGPTGVALITAVAGPNNSVLTLDRQIEGVEPPPPPPPVVPPPPVTTTNFRVLRGPRALAGEPTLQLHKDVYIDLTSCFPCPVNLGPVIGPNGEPYGNSSTGYLPWGPGNNIDILFNSTGVVGNAPIGRFILAVRHVDRPNDMLFITVYTRTGKIATHSVNDSGGDPYLFTRDGSSPGL